MAWPMEISVSIMIFHHGWQSKFIIAIFSPTSRHRRRPLDEAQSRRQGRKGSLQGGFPADGIQYRRREGAFGEFI